MAKAPFNNEIAALRQRGLSLCLTPNGEGIFLNGPKVNRTDADREWIRAHKTDLLSLLHGVTNPPANPVEALCVSPGRLKVAIRNETDFTQSEIVQSAYKSALAGEIPDGVRVQIYSGVSGIEPGKVLRLKMEEAQKLPLRVGDGWERTLEGQSFRLFIEAIADWWAGFHFDNETTPLTTVGETTTSIPPYGIMESVSINETNNLLTSF